MAQDQVAQLSSRTAVKKKASPCVVRRSRRLKFLKKWRWAQLLKEEEVAGYLKLGMLLYVSAYKLTLFWV